MELSPTSKIIITTIACVAIGAASGLVTVDAIETWYVHLNKPAFNPPNWIFGPAWTLLYTLMGIAAGLVWSAKVDDAIKRKALIVFVVQFVLNILWSLIFFNLRSPELALVEIGLLLSAIIWCMALFFPIRKAAGWLLVPYLLWVCFATALTVGIVVLNG